MRRISMVVAIAALALAFAAPLTASAAGPSRYDNFREQVASQYMIGKLLSTAGSGYDVNSIYFKRTWKSSTKAVFRTNAYLTSGSKVSGVMVLRKYSGKWYFSSITRGSVSGPVSTVPMPGGISSSILGNAIHEQGDHQYLISGIVSGGYTKLSVLSRKSNVGTVRLNIRLSRGSRPSVLGRVYCQSAVATNSTRYWFLRTIR